MPRDVGSVPPSDNVYITDLPLGMDDDALKAIFEMYGQVVQHRVMPNNPGQTKSVALVRFDSVETASWVVTSLNGHIPQGLTAPVNLRFADPPKPKVQRPGPYDTTMSASPGKDWASGGGCGKGGPPGPQLDNLYIKHLPPTTDESEVRSVFGKYGSVLQCRVFKYPNTSSALVRFGSAEEAQWVKENLQGNVPEGYVSPVEIKFYEPKGDVDFYSNGKAAVKGYPGKGEFSMKEIVTGFEKSGGLPGGTGWENNEACLYISGLPADAEDVDLYRLFNPFGAIAPRGVKVMQRPDGSCKGFGFINFQDVTAAHAAIATFHGTVLPDDSILTVKVKTESSRK